MVGDLNPKLHSEIPNLVNFASRFIIKNISFKKKTTVEETYGRKK